MVNGGTSYLKRSVKNAPFKKLSTYSDAPHYEIKQGFYWRIRVKDGNQPLEFKPLKAPDTDHIEAIIQTQTHQPSWRIEIFKAELAFRKKSS